MQRDCYSRRLPLGTPTFWLLLPALVIAAGCRQELTLDQQRLFQQALQESSSPAPSSQLRAAIVYQDLRDQGAVSVELLLNQGNAYRRAGQVGRAIGCYRRALRWNPRDARVRHNLNRLLEAQGLLQERGVASWLLRNLAPTRWLGASELLISGCGLLLAAAVIAWFRIVARRTDLGWAVCLLTVSSGWCLTMQQLQIRRIHLGAEAVIVDPETAVKTGPADGFDVAANGACIEGQSVQVIERRGEWLHVRTEQGQDGWLPRSQVMSY